MKGERKKYISKRKQRLLQRGKKQAKMEAREDADKQRWRQDVFKGRT